MKLGSLLTGIVIGAAAGLLLAPQSGRRTRALIRDKATKYSHDIGDYAGKKSRHMANKARGYAHEVRSFVSEKMGMQEAERIEEVVQA